MVGAVNARSRWGNTPRVEAVLQFPWAAPASGARLKVVNATTGSHAALDAAGPDGVSAHESEARVQTGVTATASPADDSARLVARAREGDRQAFRLLFERHRGDVSRLAYRMVGPRPDLEDLVQEVFVQVHRSLRDFRGEARFSTWLHRVTVNVVLMQRRAEKSRPVLTEELASPVEDDDAVLPDVDADRRTRVAAFFEVLESLGEKKRIVFVLHDLEGMSPADISTVVDAPVLTVRTRLFYARRELEERMRAHPLLAGIVERHGGFAGLDGGRGAKKSEATDE